MTEDLRLRGECLADIRFYLSKLGISLKLEFHNKLETFTHIVTRQLRIGSHCTRNNDRRKFCRLH